MAWLSTIWPLTHTVSPVTIYEPVSSVLPNYEPAVSNRCKRWCWSCLCIFNKVHILSSWATLLAPSPILRTSITPSLRHWKEAKLCSHHWQKWSENLKNRTAAARLKKTETCGGCRIFSVRSRENRSRRRRCFQNTSILALYVPSTTMRHISIQVAIFGSSVAQERNGTKVVRCLAMITYYSWLTIISPIFSCNPQGSMLSELNSSKIKVRRWHKAALVGLASLPYEVGECGLLYD